MSIIKVLRGIFCSLAGLMAAEGHAAEVAMFKATPGLSAVYQAATPASFHGFRFMVRTDAPIRSAPAILDGGLYFGNAAGNFYKVDANTGTTVWTAHFDSGITSSPTVMDRTVFFTTRAEKLYALDARSGAVKWTVDLGRDLGAENYWDFYTSSPIPYDSTLYVGSGDGHMRAVNSTDGGVVWSFDAGSRIRSTPAVTDSLVIFGTKAGYVMAVDRNSGALRWKFATKGVSNKFEDKQNDTTSVYASPTIIGDTVVIGGRDGQIYGLVASTGAQKWNTTHDGSSWILSAAGEKDVVYIGSGSAFILQAANVETGQELWRYKTRGAIFGAPTVAGNAVLSVDNNGNLASVDRTTGARLWELRLGDASFATPTIANGIVYVGTDAGTLYALNTAAQVQQRPEIQRYVYWAGRAPGIRGWFQNDVDIAILNYFKSFGYQQLTTTELRERMEAQVAHGGRSVVVFADDNVPEDLIGMPGHDSLIRRYVDKGGDVVFLNDNPLSFVYDAKSGELQDLQPARAEKVMDITYPEPRIEKGYHVSSYEPDAIAWGLDGFFVANGGIAPSQVSVVLARNEFGMATSWVKQYPNSHGAFLQLAVPQKKVVDFTPYRLAIEHLIDR